MIIFNSQLSILNSFSQYQWSVPTTTVVGETGIVPQAFLWIPQDCDTVRAVVFGQHNMCEETIFIHPA
ncbi:MAG: hypothetical protein LBR66_03035, partial [Candidatus Symbiothrix sp.]|nr:hypothetical protein [Candidatus Symbiothrix sp.]